MASISWPFTNVCTNAQQTQPQMKRSKYVVVMSRHFNSICLRSLCNIEYTEYREGRKDGEKGSSQYLLFFFSFLAFIRLSNVTHYTILMCVCRLMEKTYRQTDIWNKKGNDQRKYKIKKRKKEHVLNKYDCNCIFNVVCGATHTHIHMANTIAKQ